MIYKSTERRWRDPDRAFQDRLLKKIMRCMGLPPAEYWKQRRNQGELFDFDYFNGAYPGFPLILEGRRLKGRMHGPTIFAAPEQQEYGKHFCKLLDYFTRPVGLIFGATAARNGVHVPSLILHNHAGLVNAAYPVTRIAKLGSNNSPCFIQHFDGAFGETSPLWTKYFPREQEGREDGVPDLAAAEPR